MNFKVKKTIFPNRDSKKFKWHEWTFSAFVRAIIGRLKQEKDAFILITGQTGCQPAGSKVLMSNGEWKNVEEIKIGDEIISPQKDGTNKFSKVTFTTDWECNNMYNIEENKRDNQLLYRCSNNHIIPYYDRKNIRITVDGKRKSIESEWNIKNKTAQDFSNISKNQLSHTKIGFSSFSINNFNNRENCIVDPYTLGIYLGDGYSKTAVSITTSYNEIVKEIEKKYDIMSVRNKKGTDAKRYDFSVYSPLTQQLKLLGLLNKRSGDKFIPKVAKLSDYNYRKKLLAGLIDSDGYYGKSSYSYCSKSKQLVEDVRDIVYSLGGRTRKIRKIKKGIKSIGFVGEYYNVNFYLGDMDLPIKIKRKKKETSCIYLSSNRLGIVAKRSNLKERVYGFEVDSDSHWYITDNWMITHNSGKSHLAGNFNLKYLSKIDNFIKNDGSKMFEKKNFIITPDEFAVKMITERGSSLWLDEGRDAVNRQKWYSEVNQLIASRKNKNRKNFNIYWLCMPYESEVDPKMAKHLHIWIWVRRGVGEVYCRQSGKKGGTGLDIQKILDREEKWFRENPKSNKIIPTIHPEFIGRIFFNKLTAGYEREYNKLVEEKKAVGELSEEEKEQYGIIEKRSPESMVSEWIGFIKEGKIDNKKDLWVKLKEETNLPDTELKNMINFYLNLENLPSFSRLFAKKTKINKTGEMF
jgi:hypothetical protein